MGKLTSEPNELARRVIVNVEEVAKNSYFDATELLAGKEHKWLDENGIEVRKAFAMRNGTIYPIDIFVMRARDGRNILYSINVKISEAVAVDFKVTSDGGVKTTTASQNNDTTGGGKLQASEKTDLSDLNEAQKANAEKVLSKLKQKSRLMRNSGKPGYIGYAADRIP